VEKGHTANDQGGGDKTKKNSKKTPKGKGGELLNAHTLKKKKNARETGARLGKLLGEGQVKKETRGGYFRCNCIEKHNTWERNGRVGKVCKKKMRQDSFKYELDDSMKFGRKGAKKKKKKNRRKKQQTMGKARNHPNEKTKTLNKRRKISTTKGVKKILTKSTQVFKPNRGGGSGGEKTKTDKKNEVFFRGGGEEWEGGR